MDHASGSRVRVQGAGFRAQGSERRVQGAGFRAQGSGLKIQGLGITLHEQGLVGLMVRFRVQDSEFGSWVYALKEREQVKGVRLRVTI